MIHSLDIIEHGRLGATDSVATTGFISSGGGLPGAILGAIGVGKLDMDAEPSDLTAMLPARASGQWCRFNRFAEYPSFASASDRKKKSLLSIDSDNERRKCEACQRCRSSRTVRGIDRFQRTTE